MSFCKFLKNIRNKSFFPYFRVALAAFEAFEVLQKWIRNMEALWKFDLQGDKGGHCLRGPGCT